MPRAEVGGKGWLGLGLLFVLYAFNIVDRHIVNVLAEPIKRELALTDAQVGFFTGFAIAGGAFYPASGAFPAGYRNQYYFADYGAWYAVAYADQDGTTFTYDWPAAYYYYYRD